MMRKTWSVLFLAFIVVFLSFSIAQAKKEKAVPKAKTPAVKGIDEATCFGCHPEVQALKIKGKHARGSIARSAIPR